MNVRMIIITALLLLCAVPLSGCLSVNADELYSLPEISEEYLKLQANINMLLNNGAVYAAPARGPNRQAVQLRDINGSGVNEVLAFFSFPAESKLKIYIFTMEGGEDYINAEIIESVGTEYESIRYVDMDGDGNTELIVGWQMGSALKYMSIYSVTDLYAQLLVSGEEYTEIATLRTDGKSGEDVVLLKLPAQEVGNPVAKMYSLMNDGEIVTQEARLSAGIESISGIINGNLADSRPALFVESEGRYENGTLVTDILTVRNGSLTNITLNTSAGISSGTVRQRLGSTDINNDGIIEVPELRRLAAQSETEYFMIDWHAYSTGGTGALALTTYHNTFDGWFLVLPADWRDNVSVRREDPVPGERTIIFSYINNPGDTRYHDFLKIYRFSGNSAGEKAQQPGRFLLLDEGAETYAFEILQPPDNFKLTLSGEIIRENFKLIRTQWQP